MGQSKERNSNEKSGFLKKLIIVLAVAIVVVFAVFYVIYYRFSYQADKLAKETARIYAFGDGGEMADMIAPGYVKKFEDSSKVLSVSDIQDIYINKFRAYTDEQVGDIDTIECKVTDIQAVSNIEDVQQQFADNGVCRLSLSHAPIIAYPIFISYLQKKWNDKIFIIPPVLYNSILHMYSSDTFYRHPSACNMPPCSRTFSHLQP